MGIGTKIKELLLFKGISVKELSEKTGIPASTIYSIIKRDNNTVQTDILIKMANVLDVPVDDLMSTITWDLSNLVKLVEKTYTEGKKKQIDWNSYFLEQEILNSDNKERHHLLIHYYNTLDQVGRDATLEILSSLIILNNTGITEAVKRIEELTLIEKYKK